MESTILTTPSQGLIDHWPTIKTQFKRFIRKNSYVSLASVRADGQPSVSPVGSFCLNDDCTGYYLEKFTTSVAKNSNHNPRVTVLGVDPGKWFWFKSIYKGRFDSVPGIKLYGIAGPKRAATPAEKEKFLRLVKPLKRFKGYQLMWEDMDALREIRFVDFELIRLGQMTRDLSLQFQST